MVFFLVPRDWAVSFAPYSQSTSSKFGPNACLLYMDALLGRWWTHTIVHLLVKHDRVSIPISSSFHTQTICPKGASISWTDWICYQLGQWHTCACDFDNWVVRLFAWFIQIYSLPFPKFLRVQPGNFSFSFPKCLQKNVSKQITFVAVRASFGNWDDEFMWWLYSSLVLPTMNQNWNMQ